MHDKGNVGTPPLTKAQSSSLAAAYRRGTRVIELARRYEIRRQTVHEHLKKHGLTKPVNVFTPEQGDRAAELYQSGMTLAEVADAIGSNNRSVTLALEERGIRRRPRGVRVTQRQVELSHEEHYARS